MLNISISDNVAGMINLGVINNLNSALEFVGKQETGDLAGALRTFAQVVLENAELKDQEKKDLNEAWQAVEPVGHQTTVKPGMTGFRPRGEVGMNPEPAETITQINICGNEGDLEPEG